MCDSSLQALAHLLAAARRSARRARSRRQVEEERSISSSIVAVSSASDSSLGSSGANAGSAASEPSTECMRAGDLAERAQRGRGTPRVGAELVERELPAVAARRRGTPAGSRASRRQRGPRSRTSRPAARCSVEAVRGQEAQQLELRVHARLDAPERLEDQLARRRRSRSSTARRRPGARRPCRRAPARHSAQWNAACPRRRRRRRRRACGASSSRPSSRVGERVVDASSRRRSQITPLVPALVGRAQAERQLVESRACRPGSAPRRARSTSSGASSRSGRPRAR